MRDPNKTFPIIFETVSGVCEVDENSSSFYNMKEIETVMRYIIELLDGKWNNEEVSLNDIGVVSPYRKQCDKIQALCRNKGFETLTVGTAEVFQGQEKKIMILSTVRTDGTLGFLKDKRVSYISNILSKQLI